MDRYALAMQFTSVVPIGLTASGLRLDIEFTGTVTDGPLEGAEVNGIDFLLIRPDGVAVIDARERFTQDGGTVAYAHVRGFGDNPLPVSDLTALAAPDFQWPDADLAIHGAAFFESAAPHLSAATHTVFGFNGTVNVATGQIRVAGRSLAMARQPVG